MINSRTDGGATSLLGRRVSVRRTNRRVRVVCYPSRMLRYALFSFGAERSQKHTFFCISYTITALPRVGVARPNGSYVARTHQCVGRAISSRFGRSSGIVALTERLLHGY